MTSVDSDDLNKDDFNGYSKRSSASNFVELLRLYADLPRNESAVQESERYVAMHKLSSGYSNYSQILLMDHRIMVQFG